MTLTINDRRSAFRDASLTTIRAGLPLPDASWYRNPDPRTGTHTPMTFTKENFVQGFNITCGDYYILRDALIPLLRKDDVYKKRFNNPNVDYDCLWPIFEEINKHVLLAHPAHVGWRHHIVFRWITVTAEWIKRLEKADSDTKYYPFLPMENWRWGRGDLSPRKRAPYTLYKHVSIRVTNERNEPLIVRVADLVDDSARPPMGNMVDINLSNIRYTTLRDILLQNKHFGMQEPSKIEFLHPLVGNRYVAIENDKQLSYAIQHLRIRGTSKIDMRVVASPSNEDGKRRNNGEADNED